MDEPRNQEEYDSESDVTKHMFRPHVERIGHLDWHGVLLLWRFGDRASSTAISCRPTVGCKKTANRDAWGNSLPVPQFDPLRHFPS
jgi:hypothetical protein